MIELITAQGEIVDSPRVRTKFNYHTDEHSQATGLYTAQPGEEDYDGKTQQNFKEECDINTIVNNFLKTGQLPENVRLPSYIDYEGVFDFQTAMNTALQAEEAFMELPAPLRAEFDNNPQRFLEYATNPANREDMLARGLLREGAEPVKQPAAPAPAPEPAPAGTSTST